MNNLFIFAEFGMNKYWRTLWLHQIFRIFIHVGKYEELNVVGREWVSSTLFVTADLFPFDTAYRFYRFLCQISLETYQMFSVFGVGV